MYKDKVNYKLVNIAIVILIIFFMYQTGNLWLGIIGTILNIILPFFLAFIVAYALYPILKYLKSKNIPKPLAIGLVLLLVLGIITLICVLVIPTIVGQLGSLFNGIIDFLKTLATDYDISFGPLQDTLSKSFNEIIMTLGKYVSNGAVNMINVSLGYLSNFLISLSAAIYFLIDMDKIRAFVKRYLRKKSKKTYTFVKQVDKEMKKYLVGFMKIVCISLFEYTIAYYIIGHPNALLLGVLAATASLIPYFGGIIANFIACITAFAVSPFMFLKTVIVFVLLSTVDGNIINPLVYGKTNKVHPLMVIFAVFAGGILFGIIGVVISLPMAIIIQTAYHFYKEDINDKIVDMKEAKNQTEETTIIE